jgi:hypothetical protein
MGEGEISFGRFRLDLARREMLSKEDSAQSASAGAAAMPGNGML